MKKTIFLIGIFMTTLSIAKPLGLGVILGDPTGLSAKYFMNRSTAFDGTLAYGRHELILYGDYMKHFPGVLGKQNEFVTALTPYTGIGPVLAFGDGHDHRHRFLDDDEDEFALGGRIPLGVEWLPVTFPIGVSLEIAPGMRLIPDTGGFIQGGLAIRFYFK